MIVHRYMTVGSATSLAVSLCMFNGTAVMETCAVYKRMKYGASTMSIVRFEIAVKNVQKANKTTAMSIKTISTDL